MEPVAKANGHAVDNGGYRRRPDGDGKLSEAVTVKFTAAQMQALRATASADGETVPEYLRNLVISALRG